MDSLKEYEQFVDLTVFDLSKSSEQIEHIVAFILLIFIYRLYFWLQTKLNDLIYWSIRLANLFYLTAWFEDDIFDSFAIDLKVQIVILLVECLIDAIHKGLCDFLSDLLDVLIDLVLSNPLRFL